MHIVTCGSPDASQVQKYTMGPDDQCALTVLPAATSISEHIVRVLPYVHQDKNVLLCFLGYIKNQKDLEAKLDVDRSTDDVGATTTSLIAGLYSSLMEDKKEDLLLSELQVRKYRYHAHPALDMRQLKPCLAAIMLRGHMLFFYTTSSVSNLLLPVTRVANKSCFSALTRMGR